jgi:hypothetical protein
MTNPIALLDDLIAAFSDTLAHLDAIRDRLAAEETPAPQSVIRARVIHTAGVSLEPGTPCATPYCGSQAATLGADGLGMCRACYEALEQVEQ